MAKEAVVLADRYQLGPRLGRGGMAAVYRARDRILGREVAVKVLADGFASDERFVERFRREARAAAGLNHPNVVAVYDHGSDNGSHFIVMEHVEGKTLADLLAEEGPLPPELAAAITTAVGHALAAAHERGLVHRDVKPANILITGQGGVKVTDFGIARATAGSALTATGTVLGTASYLSPEQARGDAVDQRSDIYSLGCVLYEMLTGRPPFSAETAVAVASRHVHEDAEPPSSLRPGIPPELEGVAMKALAKDPGDRFQTADQMAARAGGATGADTELIERVDRTAVMPAVPPEQAPPKDRVWIPWAFAGAGLGLLLGLALLFLLGRGSPAENTGRTMQGAAPATPSAEATAPAVDQAYAAFLAVVDRALAENGITAEAADDVVGRVDVAMEAHARGDPERALDALDEARNALAGHAAEGRLEPEWAGAIAEALDGLDTALMSAGPVPPKDEDEDKGDGGGKGKGKGKGNGDGDGESDD